MTELARYLAEVVPTELLTFGRAAEEWTLGKLGVVVKQPGCIPL